MNSGELTLADGHLQAFTEKITEETSPNAGTNANCQHGVGKESTIEVHFNRVPEKQEPVQEDGLSWAGSSATMETGLPRILECSTCKQIIHMGDPGEENFISHICGSGNDRKGGKMSELSENVHQAEDMDTSPSVTSHRCVLVEEKCVSTNDEKIYSCQLCGLSFSKITMSVHDNQVYIQKCKRAKKLVGIARLRIARRLQRNIQSSRKRQKNVEVRKDKENSKKTHCRRKRMIHEAEISKTFSDSESNMYIYTERKAKEAEASTCASKNRRKKKETESQHKWSKRKCPVCSMLFYEKDAYNSHLSSHDFTCDLCGKEFKAYTNLKHHLLTHSTSKDFVCFICEKGFKARQNLSKHMLIHNKDSTLECQTCGKKFKAKPNLTKHMMTHNDWKSYQCEKCGKYFKASQNLQKHMKIHDKHKVNWVPP